MKFNLKILIIVVGCAVGLLLMLVVMNLFSVSDSTVGLKESQYVHDGDFVFVNTADDVGYVGAKECRKCHTEIYNAYVKTRTGRSMARLDSNNIIEDFPQEYAIYDSSLNYYYVMLRQGEKFFQREYRLSSAGEIVHERMLEAQYVMGSGSNLRMYFYDENGMFYQLPLTWYVHERKWDLSPGYREFNNVRFSRYVGAMCFSCHNGHMEAASSANDRYLQPYRLGIGCEKCHGPGELHVREKQGEPMDFPVENARTIVNPLLLSPQRQIDVCQQCHLEGKAWALYGNKTWFDFKPGELLQTHRSVYFQAGAKKEAFKVANSAYRLSLSRCFKDSHGAMTCIGCHDSHGLVAKRGIEFNRKNCQKCHPMETLPQTTARYAHKALDDCIPCHMNQTGKENTLHGVTNTDHWIRIDADKDEIKWDSLRQTSEKLEVVQLVTDEDRADQGSNTRQGMAYFGYWTEHFKQRTYLDSAVVYLANAVIESPGDAIAHHYLGLAQTELGNFQQAISSLVRATELNPEFAESSFRLGRAYKVNGALDKAVASYRRAVELKPGEPTYLEGLGLALSEQGIPIEAEEVLLHSLEIDKQNPHVYYVLGNIYMFDYQQPPEALRYFTEVVTLDPDFPDGYLNLGNTYAVLGDLDSAIDSYEKAILFQPSSTGAYVNLGKTLSALGRDARARNILHRALELDPTLDLAERLLNELGN